jgi:DNA-binding GntR family transcriptional regulator
MNMNQKDNPALNFVRYEKPYLDTNDEKGVPFQKPESIVDAVANFLRQSILSGNLPPGERINNAELSKRLGVSIVPFREALRILENEGLIVSHSSRGKWIANITRDDLEETFELREILEISALDLIRKHEEAGKNVKEKLKSLVIDKESFSLSPKLCASFHRNLIELAENKKLISVYNILANNIQRYQEMCYTIYQEAGANMEEHLAEHSDILDPLIKGDYQQAKTVLRSHLKSLKDLLLENVKFSDKKGGE